MLVFLAFQAASADKGKSAAGLEAQTEALAAAKMKRPLIAGSISPETAAWLEQTSLLDEAVRYGRPFISKLKEYYKNGRELALKDIGEVYLPFKDAAAMRQNISGFAGHYRELPGYLNFLKEAVWEPLELAKADLTELQVRLTDQADRAAMEEDAERLRYQEALAQMEKSQEIFYMGNFISAMEQAHKQEALLQDARARSRHFTNLLLQARQALEVIDTMRSAAEAEAVSFMGACRAALAPPL